MGEKAAPEKLAGEAESFPWDSKGGEEKAMVAGNPTWPIWKLGPGWGRRARGVVARGFKITGSGVRRFQVLVFALPEPLQASVSPSVKALTEASIWLCLIRKAWGYQPGGWVGEDSTARFLTWP